ncbi:MAG TPA: BlaI/MecI/CopY family transcriptional regulator [Blastocatellia bacterium]|nr:BlaI/MecI/CopY family transcriptional regulator [Blastocatellia bacterium]
MARKPSKTFNDRELEIMKIIWQMGEATVKEIQQRLPGEPHYNSVLTITRVLERKGHLVHRIEGKTHFYRAAESKEDSRARLLRQLIDQIFGGSVATAIVNLVQTGDLTPKDLDEIRGKIAGLSEEEKDGGNR